MLVVTQEVDRGRHEQDAATNAQQPNKRTNDEPKSQNNESALQRFLPLI